MTNFSGQEYKKIIRKSYEFLKKEKNFTSAIESLTSYINSTDSPEIAVIYWLALCYLESGNYDKAKETYLSINAFYQAGYCELLKGNLDEAKQIWKNCRYSAVKYWSKCFETIVLGHIKEIPSFLNLRNHLEADLGYLLRAKQEKFANNILLLVDDLSQINLESYKYVGRALLNNGYENVSVSYLLKGREALPNDPEIYYHLGQYSLMVGAIPEAKTMFRQCIILSPSYTPASDRLKELAKNG